MSSTQHDSDDARLEARLEARLDSQLEGLLASLGSADPAPGFEQRVLHNVELGLAERPHHSSWRLWPLGLAGAIACLLGGFIATHQLRHRHDDLLARHLPASAQTTAAAQPQLQRTTEGRTEARLTAARPASHAAHLLSPPSLGKQHSSPAAVARAAAEVQTLASFPAPPLPLTEQERLMLLILHKGDPEEIAMLNPDFRESLLARDQAEFKEFFPPPPPPPDPDPLPPATNPKGVSK